VALRTTTAAACDGWYFSRWLDCPVWLYYDKCRDSRASAGSDYRYVISSNVNRLAFAGAAYYLRANSFPTGRDA